MNCDAALNRPSEHFQHASPRPRAHGALRAPEACGPVAHHAVDLWHTSLLLSGLMAPSQPGYSPAKESAKAVCLALLAFLSPHCVWLPTQSQAPVSSCRCDCRDVTLSGPKKQVCDAFLLFIELYRQNGLIVQNEKCKLLAPTSGVSQELFLCRSTWPRP